MNVVLPDGIELCGVAFDSIADAKVRSFNELTLNELTAWEYVSRVFVTGAILKTLLLSKICEMLSVLCSKWPLKSVGIAYGCVDVDIFVGSK